MNRVHPLVTQLTAIRKLRGLDATQAARRSGLAHTTVARWERGDRSPSLTEASAYAAGLGYALTLTPTREIVR